MHAVLAIPALVQGIVAGVVALIVLSIRAAVDGRSGPSFADLWTAVAVGAAVGLVSLAIPRVLMWQMHRAMRRPGSVAWGGGVSFAPSERERAPATEPPAMDRHDRFDRFNEAARRTLTLAQDEASRFNHNYIGTEHLLLGLARDPATIAGRALLSLGVDLAKVRTATEFIIGRGDAPVFGEVGLTPRAKRVIELSIDEERRLGHREIGTGHLLLGLLREGEGIAAGVLESVGVNHEKASVAVLREMEAGAEAR